VIDVVTPLKYEPPIAAPEESAIETSASVQPGHKSSQLEVSSETSESTEHNNNDKNDKKDDEHEDLPPGTIHACYRPESLDTERLWEAPRDLNHSVVAQFEI
jgi:hypothetical protein